MIKYKLFCKECDLKFDSWFASSNEYERLKKKKLLNCHNCNSVKVEKTIMAPCVISHKSKTDKKINIEKFNKVKKTIKNSQAKKVFLDHGDGESLAKYLSIEENIEIESFKTMQ